MQHQITGLKSPGILQDCHHYLLAQSVQWELLTANPTTECIPRRLDSVSIMLPGLYSSVYQVLRHYCTNVSEKSAAAVFRVHVVSFVLFKNLELSKLHQTLFLSAFRWCLIHSLVKTMNMQRHFSAVPSGKRWDKPRLMPSTSSPSHYLSNCRLYNDISVVVIWLHALHTLIQYADLLHVIPTRRAATKNTLVNMIH